jgi:hypothetical protein
MRDETNLHDRQPDSSYQAILTLSHRLANVERVLAEIHEVVMNQRVEKEWYTTSELAEAMGKSQYTVQERWCNEGRIDCEKDPATGKWRIPGHEFRRLKNGGGLLPRGR